MESVVGSAAAAVGNGEGEGEGGAGEEDERGGAERNAEEGDTAGGAADAQGGGGAEGPAVVEPSAGVKCLPYTKLHTYFSPVNLILVLLTLIICLN